MTEPTDYQVARLHEALTHDPRLNDQSLEVSIVGDRVVLRGELATPERCQAAVDVAREMFPAAEIVADLRVSPARPAPDPEAL